MTREGMASRDYTAGIVFTVLAANATTAFAMQAWMTFNFAKEVWEIPPVLCVALVVALDLFAVMFMLLTYLLRGTGFPRFVATLVFLFAIGSQVAAAEMYGEHEDWATEIRVFASLPALILALSQEGVILWRTHRADVARRRPEKQDKRTPAPTDGEAPVRLPRPDRPTKPPATPPVASGAGAQKGRMNRRAGRQVDPAMQAKRDEYARRVIAGERAAAVAKEAGVSERSIQNWVASYRERFPDQPTHTPTERVITPGEAADLEAKMFTDVPHGHRPEVSVTQ
jgi:hypothetical protein